MHRSQTLLEKWQTEYLADEARRRGKSISELVRKWLTVSYELVETLLTKMHGILAGDDVRAKPVLLSKVLVQVWMAQAGGKLTYTFPLHEVTGICTVPPRGFEIKEGCSARK